MAEEYKHQVQILGQVPFGGNVLYFNDFEQYALPVYGGTAGEENGLFPDYAYSGRRSNKIATPVTGGETPIHTVYISIPRGNQIGVSFKWMRVNSAYSYFTIENELTTALIQAIASVRYYQDFAKWQYYDDAGSWQDIPGASSLSLGSLFNHVEFIYNISTYEYEWFYVSGMSSGWRPSNVGFFQNLSGSGQPQIAVKFKLTPSGGTQASVYMDQLLITDMGV